MHASGMMIAIGAAVIALVAVFAGSSVADTGGSSADYDSGDVVMENEIYAELKIGETYVWKLKSNPTTGFDWHIMDEGPFTVEKDYIYKGAPGIVGAGGTTVFRITSDVAGENVIHAGYYREWEDKEPISTVTLHLIFS